jgi:hypothetical protein
MGIFTNSAGDPGAKFGRGFSRRRESDEEA